MSYFVVLLHLSLYLGRVVSLGYDEPCSPGELDECDLYSGYRCQEDVQRCRCLNEAEMENVRVENATGHVLEYCHVFVEGTCYIPPSENNRTNNPRLACSDSKAYCYVRDWDIRAYCECNTGFRPSEEGRVGRDVRCLPASQGMYCGEQNENLPCHEEAGLVCRRGVCQCWRPLQQNYYWEEGKCLGIVEGARGSCSPDVEGEQQQQCLQNAYCGEDRVCHCSQGWTPYLTATSTKPICALDYGMECGDEMNIIGTCNSNRGLSCLEGWCHCYREPDARYDPLQNLCGGVEGSVCDLEGMPNISGPVVDDRLMGERFVCFTGLECVPSGSGAYYGVCTNMTVTK